MKEEPATLASRVCIQEGSNVVKTPCPCVHRVQTMQQRNNPHSTRLLARHDINVSSTLLLAALDSSLLVACAGRAAEQVVETACVA